MKTCTMEGCANKLIARGLCSTHYNRRYQPNRHRPKTRPCAWCGIPVTGSGGGGRRYGAACSTACRAYIGMARPSASTAVVHIPRAAKVDTRPRTATPTRKRWFAGNCATCAAPFISEHFERTCGPACATERHREAKRADKHRRRAIILGADHERFTSREVHERDGWTCWLCHLPVDRDADPQSDYAPSLDHIIPLANGGTHQRANAATAHRGCNARRSNHPTLTVNGNRVAVLF